MSRPIDMSAWNSQHGRASASAVDAGRAYVLVADANPARVEACLASIEPFNLGVLVARDGEEAVGMLERFGPPALLITDLSLSRKNGFEVVDALVSVARGDAEIIAWSSCRAQREFAAHRLGRQRVRVLGSQVAPAVLGGAIERALRDGAAVGAASISSPTLTAEETDPQADWLAGKDAHQVMTELSFEARRLCGTPGVAVYLKAPGETKVRAFVSWTSDVPIPHAQYWMPRVFGSILDTGDALVLPDVAAQPLPEGSTTTWQDVVGGLVAVPILDANQEIVGTICVFDLMPLTTSGAEVEALKALGRRGSSRSSGSPVGPDAAARQEDVVADAPLLDPAAPLLDRRGGDLAIARELARMRRERGQLSVVVFDVDPLRRADGPDRSASALAPLVGAYEALTRAIRGSDLAIHWTSEELLVVLPGLDVAEARRVAERVRASMQAGAKHAVMVSGGVAELLPDDTFESVVAKAKEKVRLAQARGHNRVA